MKPNCFVCLIAGALLALAGCGEPTGSRSGYGSSVAGAVWPADEGAWGLVERADGTPSAGQNTLMSSTQAASEPTAREPSFS